MPDSSFQIAGEYGFCPRFLAKQELLPLVSIADLLPHLSERRFATSIQVFVAENILLIHNSGTGPISMI